jgi:hypothetical protein
MKALKPAGPRNKMSWHSAADLTHEVLSETGTIFRHGTFVSKATPKQSLCYRTRDWNVILP